MRGIAAECKRNAAHTGNFKKGAPIHINNGLLNKEPNDRLYVEIGSNVKAGKQKSIYSSVASVVPNLIPVRNHYQGMIYKRIQGFCQDGILIKNDLEY